MDSFSVKGFEMLMEPSWRKILHSQFNQPYFKRIVDFLIQKEKNEIIYPPKNFIFEAFRLCPFDKIKVVIIGQDPYHGKGQAHGLAFSVQKGIAIPKSLHNIYKEVGDNYKTFKKPKHGNLESWAKQGVFLINTVLTVTEHKPESHKKSGWKEFINEVIRIISKKKKHVVFLLWGRHSQACASLIDSKRHHILKAAHPSPLSSKKFFGCKHFSKTNEILTKHSLEPINWNSLNESN
ncbi:uracil-DNA glycosylase [Anaeramoeba ignava]|uniref:Uracil-DNA glycosylase n=1 Tax=Anaeramoeba ignava TaxID=1746090 RepID=A0A9Q0LYZ3_ANAIG|nr:uracil-DNA glycosylase [Anaeramoeba ignava]